MVSMALLGLLLVLCTQLVDPSLRIWDLNRARADLDQSALVVVTRLERDLVQTHREAISFRNAGPCALAFPVPSRYEALTGKPLFDSWVIYSLDPVNRVLYRRQWSVPAVTEPEPLAEPQLTLMAVAPSSPLIPPLRRVAGHVAALRAMNLTTANVPVRVELDFFRPAKRANETTFRVLELNPRNTL
jgi:hypothetical protein